MIEAYTFTNQDDVVCNMDRFVVLPKPGDKIEVKFKGKFSYSIVKSINHHLNSSGEPTLAIELWSEHLHQRRD